MTDERRPHKRWCSALVSGCDCGEEAAVRAIAARQETRLDDALARWLASPTRSYNVGDERERGFATYGYDVAMAEVRSILRDPSGEHSTYDPSPAERRLAAPSAQDETP